MAKIIHNDLGRTKHCVATAVRALDDYKDSMIGLAAVVPQRNGLVPVRIEEPTKVLDGLDAMALE